MSWVTNSQFSSFSVIFLLYRPLANWESLTGIGWARILLFAIQLVLSFLSEFKSETKNSRFEILTFFKWLRNMKFLCQSETQLKFWKLRMREEEIEAESEWVRERESEREREKEKEKERKGKKVLKSKNRKILLSLPVTQLTFVADGGSA